MAAPAHGSCDVVPVERAVSSTELTRATVTILVVDGMGCRICGTRVRDALLQPSNVLAVDVELRRGLATVYSRGPVDSQLLAEAVRRTGETSGQRYQVRPFATVRPATEGAACRKEGA